MKKLFKSRWMSISVMVVFVFAGYLTFTTINSKTEVVSAKVDKTTTTTYEGTIYISSMGGFIVKADVIIDPSKEYPIQIIRGLTRQFLMKKQDINISKRYYPTHDTRIDYDRGVMLWSAFFMDDRDPANKGVRYGKVDLKTGKVLFDGLLPAEPRNKKPIQYCASGQTKDKYLVVMMGFETFIDIIDKDTMKHERRVFLDEIPEFKEKKYLWTHGTNSIDMKEFAIATTLSDEGGKFPRGKETRDLLFIVDMKSLLAGKVKVLRKATYTSDPQRSAFFRLNYTSDGKYLLIANKDRTNIIDARTLKEVAIMMQPAGWESHEFYPLPDDRYAILTQKVPVDNLPGQMPQKVMDGWIELVDISKLKDGKLERIGKATSVCMPCHRYSNELPWKVRYVPALICGINAIWKK